MNVVSISKYADPDADGVTPVLRSATGLIWCCRAIHMRTRNSHSFRRASDGLDLMSFCGLGASTSSVKKTGGKVVPTGPLTLLLSAMAMVERSVKVRKLSSAGRAVQEAESS